MVWMSAISPSTITVILALPFECVTEVGESALEKWKHLPDLIGSLLFLILLFLLLPKDEPDD